VDRPRTWRGLLEEHGDSFLKWLESSGRELASLNAMAETLEQFLIGLIDHARVEYPDAPMRFWELIPVVRACCEKPETFEEYLAVPAYAYVHLLERYRRTWSTLRHLTESGVLPLGKLGTRVLDVGSGPAPALYAIDDFYRALTDFARESTLRP